MIFLNKKLNTVNAKAMNNIRLPLVNFYHHFYYQDKNNTLYIKIHSEGLEEIYSKITIYLYLKQIFLDF